MADMTGPKPKVVMTPKDYAGWRTSILGAVTEAIENRLLFDMIGDPKQLDVLDVGCGEGSLTISLAQSGARAHGIDIFPAMIREATDRASRSGVQAGFSVAEAGALLFPPQSFDLILAKTVLCFVREPRPVLDEFARALRPGGVLVIGELGKQSLWAARRRIHAWFGSALWRRAHFRTPGQLKDLVANAGLTATELRGAVYYLHSDFAARMLGPADPWFSRLTTFGAAFLALKAQKPPAT
jgi:2-polyprenyl-3-methyl-5-hydroxy-6-metoxy-1,4-benzoquinol methylase